ncbi:MAG: hypothetical protein ACI81R_003609 [Bradymonadia bacterium]|jgi:hypothetical protein
MANRISRPLALLCCTLLAALTACSSDNEPADDDTNSALDATSDAVDDSTSEADAEADAGEEDTENDTSFEDVQDDPDVPNDTTTPDADPDIEDDADPDTSTDVEADATLDTVTDIEVDTTPDVQTDIATDTQTDAGTGLPSEGVCGLVANGDAESGTTAGWTLVEGEFFSVAATPATPVAFEGAQSFGAGAVGRSEMSQRIDVRAWADSLASGEERAVLSAHVRTWSGNDEPYLTLRAYDASGELLGSAIEGPWDATSWTRRNVLLDLPADTAELEVALVGVRQAGSDNDAYFDAIDVCLGGPVPGPTITAPPYLMWVTPDAVSVRWETADALVGTIEVFRGDEATQLAETSAGTTHELRVEGLEAATRYEYRITWDGGSTERWSFRTALPTTSDDPYTFVIWGDNQNGPENFATITPIMAALAPDFGVSTGDCVQNGTRVEYRSQLFGPLAPFGRHVPFLIGAGNHERYSDSGAALFDEYMSQPGDEHCFGWSYGSLFLMFIDTELRVEEGEAQRQCITDALSSEEALSATFRGAVFHKPPRVEFWEGGTPSYSGANASPWVRTELEPLLESLDVDVVFNGHNHLYAHTPETDGGITWITTGGAGGALDRILEEIRVGTWPQMTTQHDEFHFLYARVAGDTMTIEARRPDGSVLHTSTVVAD